MSDYNIKHVPFDWEAEGAIPISREEAEESIFKKVPTPTFKLVQGPDVRIGDLPMMSKANVNAKAEDAVRSIPALLTKLRPVKKMRLPMFSFCVNGMIYAIVLDVESGVPLFKALKALDGFAYFAYNSASAELERPRFRVILPLAKPVKAEVFDYCKARLHEAFGKITDIHSFESKRFFFMPSTLTGPFNEDNVIKTAEGASIDFFQTTGFNLIDEMRMQEKQLKKGEAKFKNVIDDERVEHYLSTDYPMMKGNGDSASSFYTAICVCLAHGDEETLEQVCDKARSEKWSEKEIRHNIQQAKKFLKL